MLLLLACAAPSGDAPADTAPADTGSLDTAADTAPDDTAAPMEVAFRYVVIADPHVTVPAGEALDRLDRAVAWVNAEREARDLRLVLIVGDIAWSDGLDAARASLDRLTIPYVPLNGDNEVQLGWEEAYHTAFATQFDALAATFPDWTMAPAAVENPEHGVTSWFHNVAFTYEGVRFVGLDWASRDIQYLLGEFGELHDFEGGTFPFFEAQIAAAAGGAGENVVMFGHIPMHLGAFDLDEMARIAAVTAPLADHVWADLAGHYHGSASERVEEGGYDLHVTDATWDDDVELRIVEVRTDGARFAPTTALVVVP